MLYGGPSAQEDGGWVLTTFEGDTGNSMETADIFRAGRQALDFFFTRPGKTGALEWCGPDLLALAAGALTAEGRTAAPAGRPAASACDYLNALAAQGSAEAFAGIFYEAMFQAFLARRALPAELERGKRSADGAFLLELLTRAVRALTVLTEAIPSAERTVLLPSAAGIFSALLDPDEKKAEDWTDALAARLQKCDPFARHRAFRISGGELVPVHLDSAKDISKFFGFPSVRAIYRDHFADFAAGKSNLPLLIYSLPGYGKTSMTVSHELAHPEIVVILPGPEVLEGDWRKIVEPLRLRKDKKFVLFFDDVDPRSIDWYNFRTHVGGAFSLPENTMPVLSSNYEFPAGILSRGRQLSYPVFDELRCSEMIEDYLKDFGLHKPPRNLVALMGADYTEEFGQKKFTELSPRTLMRYLAAYQHDQNKRRTMAELSLGELVTHPDAELFYEFNIELMRSLYGEEYIQRLLKRKLKDLE